MGLIRRGRVSKRIVTFDDTWYHIEVEDYECLCLGCFEYDDCLDILLTEKQRHSYIGECTNREFNISQSRIDKCINFIYWDKNPWRRNNKTNESGKGVRG
jgi:hypothetical protein